ncbi:MAG TPA: protein kinase [Vicinamibacteria bacterium]|nr:protein kinase [Vicinamibacteria bacterium]
MRRFEALVLACLTLAPAAGAQEWHEFYRAGVTALERGDAVRATGAFARAIALRPEPGRNVRTYGTNVEPRYFPYLRLAEAQLALGDWDAARESLDRSAQWNREPADERQRLRARLEAALPTKPAPPPTTLAPPVTTAASPPVTTLAAAPVEPPPPAPLVASAAPSLPPPSPSARASAPASAPPPATAPAVAPATVVEPIGVIEVVSRPAGASVYVDDELAGSTDPQSGRLVRYGLAPGSHRIRLTLAGHADASEEVHVAAGERAAVEIALRRAGAGGLGGAGGLFAFAIVALALVAVMAWSFRRGGATEIPAPATPAGQLSPGATRDASGHVWFGDYKLVEPLGRGGMASVFKAERRGEVVALKRPLSGLMGDPEFLERFQREAEIGRALNHPNIVRILERGEQGGVPYFTMEYVAGETLREVVARGPADPKTAATIVAQIAEALDFAHSKGVVHRDLKPSNVMLSPGGGVRVMDFGISRARRFQGITATAAFLGTPDYLAPEMIEGHGSEPRSDLYAVGVLLFELLTGRRPFVADTPYAVLRKHCSEAPPDPASLTPGVAPELATLALRLLEKDPDDRPASAEELVIALRDFLNRAA